MGDETNNNPWATALASPGYSAEGSSPSVNPFRMSKVTPTARYLEYMLDGETFSINGDAYEGFTRIWKILLSGRKQVNDAGVVKVLRSSGLTDETLGNAWQEASQAILLDTDSDPRDDLQMEDAMEWRDFIILLDTCYRMSTNDLKSFMKRFSLPSARSTAIRGKKNPFQAKPASDYPSPMSSPDLARSMRSIPPSANNHSQSVVSSNPASPEAPHSVHVVNSSSSYHEGGPDNSEFRGVPSPVPRKAPRYLEDLQEHSHADGLKEFTAAYGSSTLAGLETASVSTFSDAPEVYESDVIPLIPGASRMAGNNPRQRPISLDQRSDYSGIDPFTTPRTSNASQKELEHLYKASSRGSLQGSIIRKPTPRSALSIDSRTGNPPSPGIFEVEAPHCTPETRRIVKNRLMEIESSDPSASSGDLSRGLKRLSLSRSKSDQTVQTSQFSLSTLATGLERSIQEGSLPIVEAFFEFGADPNYSTRGSKVSKPIRHRALDFAAISGHSLIVDYLVHRGADSTAVNTALVYAVIAGKVDIATRLIEVHHANVDSGVYLQQNNPDYNVYARTGLRSHIEYLNVLSAALDITDQDERIRFVRLLISRNCNVNASIWKVYKIKEVIAQKRLTATEDQQGVHIGYPKIVHDGFGYSPLARFTPMCPVSVKILLQAGAESFNPSRKPPQQILDTFKVRGFPCKTYNIVQPISCITSEAWLSNPAGCIETVEALAHYGAKLSCDESNGYEEKHAWRSAAWGAFEEKWSPSSTPLTPLRRATDGTSQKGVACLMRLDAQS